MKKLILAGVICLLIAGCGDEKKTIELPGGLVWGMTIDDVKERGINIGNERILAGQKYYNIKSKYLPELNFKTLRFNNNDELTAYNNNNNYYPSLLNDDKYDLTGEKAISLYYSYISKFDKIYYSEGGDDKKITPHDNFWFNYPCEKQSCLIKEKTYLDDNGTKLKVAISYSKSRKGDEIIGGVGVYFSQQ